MKKLIHILMFALIGLSANAQIPTWQWATHPICNSQSGVGGGEGLAVALDDSENVYFTGDYIDSIFWGNYDFFSGGEYTGQGFITKYNSSGNLIWAKSSHYTDVNGNGGSSIAGITKDIFGNFYCTGYYYDSAGIDTFHFTHQNYGIPMFILKLESSGNILWVKCPLGGTYGGNSGIGIATDNTGNVYVTGNFTSPTMTFDTITLTGVGSRNIFIAKYNSSGDIIWAKSAPGTGTNASYGITCDAARNAYITGYFSSPTITFGSTVLSNSGGQDIFLAKYDSSGNVIWAKGTGGVNDDKSFGIATKNSKDLYITGSFKSPSILFGNYTLSNIINNTETAFLTKYDSSGNVIWAKASRDSSASFSYCVTIDNNDNPYISGGMEYNYSLFFDTVYLPPIFGDDPMFIVKYDSAGHALWGYELSGGSDDQNAIVVSPSKSVYVAGDLLGNTVIGNDSLIFPYTEMLFVAKLGFPFADDIPQISPKLTISLYPNPTSGTITLSYNSQLSSRLSRDNSQLKIYDVLGQQVYTQAITNPNQTTINVFQLSNGVYFYQLTNGTETYRGKFVKE
jgi:hypothetical protein